MISLFFVALTAFATPAHLSLLEDGSHCVAYRAKKTVLFISTSSVVGKNCDISVQVLPEVGGLYHIEVNIPIRSFQSDDNTRDEDVRKILKADVRPELTFKSEALTADQWRALFAKGEFDIDGFLSIGDGTFPLKLKAVYERGADSPEVDGVANVHFEDLGLKPPKVFLGLVARSKSDLELHFHFLGSRILGADSIRLDPEKSTGEIK